MVHNLQISMFALFVHGMGVILCSVALAKQSNRTNLRHGNHFVLLYPVDFQLFLFTACSICTLLSHPVSCMLKIPLYTSTNEIARIHLALARVFSENVTSTLLQLHEHSNLIEDTKNACQLFPYYCMPPFLPMSF